ncbi:MAG: PQQ-dependent sugar dehydrogenase, partial [Ilumatobacteraceae bacterium]
MSVRRAVATALTAATSLFAIAACGGGDQVSPGPSVTFGTQPPATTTTAPPATTVPPSLTPTTVATTVPTTTEPLGDPVIALEPIGTFADPVDVAWRAGDDTMFVVERGGTIVPVRDGATGTPVLDISELTQGEGERGLLGLTFGTDGNTAYVNHTDNDGNTIIAEYLVGIDGTFDASSRRVLLGIDQPYGNHNGGNVTIGPDGMLYIGMGDGGSGGDPERRSLNVTTLLGKILRIDPTPTASTSYTIPADNPFVGVAGARPEIWSVGVRNPWRMSFDSVTEDLWFGDVGQG